MSGTKLDGPGAQKMQTLDDALSKAVSEAFTSQDIQALDRPQVEVERQAPDRPVEILL